MRDPIRTLKWGLILFFAAALSLYVLFETREVLMGPQIALIYPQDGDTVQQEVISITGTAHNISHLSLNGRQIFTDTAGVFKEQLLVPEGYTILELKAEDRFNRETIQHIRIIRKEN